METVFIVDGVRSAIGTFGGSLKDVAPTTLAAKCIEAVVQRSGIDADEVGHVVMGNVIHTQPSDMYLSRVAAIEAGIPKEAPAFTLNRLCGSGVQAVVSAAQTIMLGDTDCAIAGGAESMSRAPHSTQAARWGTRFGDQSVTDMLIGALTDPFGNGHMGVTAENVADRWDVSREAQDRFALKSQRRAAAAIDEGRFRTQILPLEVKAKGKVVTFDTDEHVKRDTTLDGLGGLKPAFKAGGSVTAGNSSGVNDGGAALLLMGEGKVKSANVKPMARIIGYAHAGVDPSEMGVGPIPAVKALLARTGMKAFEFSVIECNEAFASQSCAVARELELDPETLNPNGGAIALGHPIGATGSIIIVKTLYELQRTGGRYGLVTMCIGGGQGIALAIENLSTAS
ncbi:acetyl-CoA C-acyltransferase family protein [Mesorhizobium sp. CAU 1732]|uniref:acetyl-CoA C-acyltransferase family protein n=1 Tax=Mesorhizobium sp. CAU 1732 TaxID=3140358 RepID=UPI0032600974